MVLAPRSRWAGFSRPSLTGEMMSKNDTTLGRRFGPYVVGVFDVLGQKRALYQLPGGGDPDKIREGEIGEYLKNTVGRVLGVRKLFTDQFAYSRRSMRRILESHNATTLQRRVFKPAIRHWGMSDSYVVAVLPPDGTDFSIPSRLINVYRMLEASAAVWLLAMNRGLPIRGGIELGLGIDVGRREVYGHALAQAHWLESEVAQYPRVVVGMGLVGLLNSAAEETALRNQQETDMVHQLAGMCWDYLRQDEDGTFAVHMAAGRAAAVLRESFPGTLAGVANAVREQLKTHQDADNRDTLVKRYEWLQRSLADLPEMDAND